MIHNFICKQKSDRNGSGRGVIGNFDTVGRIFNTAENISFVEQRIDPAASIFNLGRRNQVTAEMVIEGVTVKIGKRTFTANLVYVFDYRNFRAVRLFIRFNSKM